MSSQSLYSQSTYISRQREEQIISEWLNESGVTKPTLYLNGLGGIGKTQLLHRLKDLSTVQPSIVILGDIIDLYATENRQLSGIALNIARQLESVNDWDPLTKEYIQKLLQLSSLQNAANINEALLGVLLEVLNHKSLVIRIDTFELAPDYIKSWIIDFVMAVDEYKRKEDINQSLLVAIAGREAGLFKKDVLEKWCLVLNPSPFSAREVIDYFQQKGLTEISEDTAKRIAELSNGRPILIALSVDWMKYAGKTPQDFFGCDPQDFERRMIERVRELRTPQDKVIYAMAHLHRRFDREILSKVLGIDDKSSRHLIDSISKFSFVKNRPGDGENIICQLHDEMIRLMKKYAWIGLDDFQQTRQKWSKKVVDIYTRRIEEAKDSPTRQALEIEKLGYICDYSPDEAFNYWNDLHENFNDDNIETREAINAELSLVLDKLNIVQRNWFKSRVANILFQQGKTAEAIALREELLRDPSYGRLLQAAQKARLVEMYAESGSFKKAREYAEDTKIWFSDNLPESFPEQEYRSACRYHGMFHTNLGYMMRKLGKSKEALREYKKALGFYSNAGKRAYKNIGSVRTNLAYAHHLVGEDQIAVKECQLAIKYREKFDQIEVGISYNVMGIIRSGQLNYYSAEYWFEKARESCRQVNLKRGEALVDLAHGRLLHQQGRCVKEQVRHGLYCTIFPQAREMLERAVKGLNTDAQYLAEALNDLGTLYRNHDYLDEAIVIFDESLTVCRRNELSYWKADNYQDRSVTHKLLADRVKDDTETSTEYIKFLNMAESDANQALEIAGEINSYQTISRSQRTLADIAFSYRKYEQAFKLALSSIQYLLRTDEYSLNESPAKKEVLFDEWLTWLTDMLLEIPDAASVKVYGLQLKNDWVYSEGVTGESKRRTNDFIQRINDFIDSYEIIK